MGHCRITAPGPTHAAPRRVRSGVQIVIETQSGEFFEGSAKAPGVFWARAAETTLLVNEGNITATPAAPRVVLRTGFLPDEDDPNVPGPRTWVGRGWEALDRAVEVALSRSGPRMLIRPAWTDVISDAPSSNRFLDRRQEWGDGVARLGLLLDPAAMLAPTMIANAEDHITRILELVASREGVDGVVASNIEVRDGAPRRAAIHQGVIDASRLTNLYRSLVPATVPVILTGEDIESQREAIGAVGR